MLRLRQEQQTVCQSDEKRLTTGLLVVNGIPVKVCFFFAGASVLCD